MPIVRSSTHGQRPRRLCPLAIALVATLSFATTGSADEALPAEPIPHSLTLPVDYPPTWVFAHDFNFAAIVDGKVAILDVAADTRPYKGHIDAGQFASFLASKTRPEFYVAQTFMSRRTYGERVDTIAVFDRETLTAEAEIVLPPKRMQVVTHKNSFQTSPDERLGYVMNFTPAASVTVVDLVARKVLAENPNPSCNFVFATGARGYSSLCADGALATFQLAEDGSVASTRRTESFIDIDADPIYAKNATTGGITYFPSFRGRMQPIDFRGDAPKVLEAWPLVPEADRAARWAPGGWQVIDAGPDGRLYVLMHEGATEGTHKFGGTEVWVYDPVARERVARYALAGFSVSVAVTKSDPAYLVVTNANMELDVYAAADGVHQRTLHVNASANPMVVHAP